MTPRPDFLRPVRSPQRLTYLVCATALAVLAVALLDATDAWTARRAASAARAMRAVASTPRTTAPTETARAWRAAEARLARPWAGTFEALESAPRHGVSWLAMDIDERGRVRLEGLSPDAGAALAVAAALRRTGAWTDVLVTRIDKAGDGGRRFTITATAHEGAG